MSDPISIEVCVDSLASAMAAERGGARRVELCSNLLEGGVTPSAGLIEAARTKTTIGLHVMIRPRGGDFCYTAGEFETMRRDIGFAQRAGADGVVFGILDHTGSVDVQHTRDLVDLARPLKVTFHRAFDLSADLFRALEDVCETGADRILTSGGKQTAVEAIPEILSLVKAARGRISIMACGCIRANNAAAVIAQTGVQEIHVGLRRTLPSTGVRNQRVSIGTAPDRKHERFEVFEEDVRELQRAVTMV